MKLSVAAIAALALVSVSARADAVTDATAAEQSVKAAQSALAYVSSDASEPGSLRVLESRVSPLLENIERTIRGSEAIKRARRAMRTADAPVAHALLMYRHRWATFWDYGVSSTPKDAFVESGDCEREAQRLEGQDHSEPLFAQGGPMPHYFCEPVTTQAQQITANDLLEEK